MPVSPPSDRFLPPGCTFGEYLPAGTLLVCTEGSLTLQLPAIDLAESALRPTLRLDAGDTCQLEVAGWVTGMASRNAALRILAPDAAPAQLARLLARVTRRLAPWAGRRGPEVSAAPPG